ncbi:vanadium-dependent haloperoxidase [Streptomyces sp. NPDC001700]
MSHIITRPFLDWTARSAGRWTRQPTPPSHAPATQYGNRLARPFVLPGADQFRLGPPPALDSRTYRSDLAEVRAYGSADSTQRSACQTQTANFWYGSSLALYTEPLRVALARSAASLEERAKLVALFHIASVDTQIATSDTKYAYQRWRPVTAIRTGAIDNDPHWTPLHDTPAIRTTRAATTPTRERRRRYCPRSSVRVPRRSS